ncbi:MAG: SDR family NAD(P)-dependent oxidoreductase, partial [Pedobacter sp.]
MEIKTIAILGCGWYGLPMANELIQKGYKIKGSTTTEAKLNILEQAGITPFLIDFKDDSLSKSKDFFECDVLLIAIPPKAKETEGLNYAEKIKQIAEIASENNVKQIILISSTGIYPDNNFIVDETIVPIPNTVAGKALQEGEQILASNNTFKTTIIRFAGLIGPERNLAKHFAGKADIANGLAPINL